MPHALLVTPSELPRFAVDAAFLERFRVRTLQLEIVTPGALGTMALRWRRLGAVDWSATQVSSPVATWTLELDEAFAVLTFPADTYSAGTYTITEDGVVTRQNLAVATPAAARYDLRQIKCQEATDLAIGWMKPEVVPPILAWGNDVKGNCAAMVAYLLLSHKGLASVDAAPGDSNARLRYEDARAWFQGIGRGQPEPDGLVDSSADAKPGRRFARPVSDERSGF